MKIDLNSKAHPLTFKQLEIGDVFTFAIENSSVYMKIEENKRIIELNYKCKYIKNEYRLSDTSYWEYENAVNLETGKICEIKRDTNVVRINAKLVVDN